MFDATLPTAASPSNTSLTLLLGLGADAFPESAISSAESHSVDSPSFSRKMTGARLSLFVDPRSRGSYPTRAVLRIQTGKPLNGSPQGDRAVPR